MWKNLRDRAIFFLKTAFPALKQVAKISQDFNKISTWDKFFFPRWAWISTNYVKSR